MAFNTAAILAEARREAEFQVRRLRKFACVAAWFGDNENDVLADGAPAWRKVDGFIQRH